MHHLRDVGVRREGEYDVIERNWADKVDKKPRSEIVSCDRYRLHDDVFDELVRDDTYSITASLVIITQLIFNVFMHQNVELLILTWVPLNSYQKGFNR